MLGYPIFILLLILPGLFGGLLAGLLKGKRFIEVLAFSFGISLGIVPLVLVVISILWRSITMFMVLGVVLVSTMGVLLLLWLHAVRLGKLDITRIELAAISLVPVQGTLLSLQFIKYPIFPMTFSSDFGYHLQRSLQLQAGDVAVTEISYPPAIHLFLASALSLQSDISISVIQHALVIIGSLAPLLIFALASRIFVNSMIGLVASLIYVFTGSLWYTAIFSSGLYANFLANLVTLAVLLLIVEGFQKLTHAKRIMLFFLGASLFISHYTVVIFIAALWLALPVVWRRARNQLSNHIQMLGLITLPGGLLAILRPEAVTYLFTLPGFTGRIAGIYITGEDLVSDILAQLSPFLHFLYQEVGPGLLAVTFASIPLTLYLAFKQKDVWTPILIIWFLLIWIVTPYSEIAWRFSKLAVLPLALIWPFALIVGVGASFSKLTRRKIVKRKGKRPKMKVDSMHAAKTVIVLALSVVILYNSATHIMLLHLSTSSGAISQNQREVYDSMHWLVDNRDDARKILGVGDWRFVYFRSMWGRETIIKYDLAADEAYNLVRSEDYQYVVVSEYLVMPPWSTLKEYTYESTYKDHPNFKMEYSNPSVRIYSIKS